jgi:hypothetical protein
VKSAWGKIRIALRAAAERRFDVEWLIALLAETLGAFAVGFVIEMPSAAAAFLTRSAVPLLISNAILVVVIIRLPYSSKQSGWFLGALLGLVLGTCVGWYLKDLHFTMGIPLML